MVRVSSFALGSAALALAMADVACGSPPPPVVAAPVVATTAPTPTPAPVPAPAPVAKKLVLELPEAQDAAPALAACDGGDLAACTKAADLLLFGWGVPTRPTVAERVAKKACGRRDATACWLSAVARTWLGLDATTQVRAACAGGNEDACVAYASTAEAAKLPSAAAKKLFKGQTAALVENTACDAMRGASCLAQLSSLAKHMPPSRVYCMAMESCTPAGGPCVQLMPFLDRLEVDPPVQRSKALHCASEADVGEKARAAARAACDAGRPLCYRASLAGMKIEDTVRVLRAECVDKREPRACARLADKLAGLPREVTEVDALVLARLVAAGSGGDSHAAWDGAALFETPGDKDEKSASWEDAKAALEATKAPADARWVEVAEASRLVRPLRACERQSPLERQKNYDSSRERCPPILKALAAVDRPAALERAHRYCKDAPVFCELEKSLRAAH